MMPLKELVHRLTLTHGMKPSTSSKARWILIAAMWQRLFNRAGLCMFRPERFIRSDTPAPLAYWASLRATEQLRCSLLLTESAGEVPDLVKALAVAKRHDVAVPDRSP